MSRDFRDWLVWSTVATILVETILYYIITPETRLTPDHQALMWLMLPFASVLNLFAFTGPIPRRALD